MKNLEITKAKFLEWYFDDGEGTSEYDTLRIELAEKVIDRLKKGNTATITTEEIFNEICNKSAIRLSYCEGYYELDEDLENFYDVELESLKYEYTITLID